MKELQDAIRRHGLDGWLFFDHHHRDPIAYRVLHLDQGLSPSRRWYYFVPASGEPRKLVHRIESRTLESLPGETALYSSWPEQQTQLAQLLRGAATVAMQYSPNCAIPYVANVDAGTLELVRQSGVSVVTSADLVQEFEARWSAEQFQQHREAGRRVDQVRRQAFEFVGERLRSKVPLTEYQVQRFILDGFAAAGLVTDHGPIVAVNQNASDPHYEPSADRHSMIQPSDVLLIDLWAKLDVPASVYYDVTWTGFCGTNVPNPVQRVFEVVKGARKAATSLVKSRLAEGGELRGWEVDDAARQHIVDQQLGPYFFHRTGHSIGTEVHGNGANMDNFESHDERRIISHTCFSVEPGVYLPEFGIRSEVNVFVVEESATITGEEQEELVKIAM